MTPHSKTSSLSLRLSRYAAFGGAALLAPAASQAGVVYSGTMNQTTTDSTPSVPIDLDGDGTVDFTLSAIAGTVPYVYADTVIGNTSGNYVVGSSNNATNLALGTIISAGSAFDTGSSDYLAKKASSATQFSGNTPGYVGLEFTAPGNPGATYYGWAEIQSSAAGSPSPTSASAVSIGPSATATLLGYAYDSSGNSIAVGDTTGALSAAPEPSSLALFALGAAGLALVKHRRQAVN